MLYHGRDVDVLALWGPYVELPAGLSDPLPTFLPKVRCPNPSHDTNKRHYQINARHPYVHCFANCGISGSYEHALCVIHGIYEQREVSQGEVELAKQRRTLDEPPEVSRARERVGACHKQARRIILENSQVFDANAMAEPFGNGVRKSVAFDSQIARDSELLDGGEFTFMPKRARDYLDRRGIDSPSRGKWQLGYDESSDRLVIPAHDHRGQFRFLIRREIEGRSSTKYLYTKGAVRASILFGACFLDHAEVQSTGIILVEGPLDAVRMHQLGYQNTVAILGSGISTQQVRLIDKFHPRQIYLMFDADAEGVKYVLTANEKLTKFPLRVCRYPNDKSDPGELTKEEADRSISRALPISEWFVKARMLKPTRRTNGKLAAA